MKNIRKKLLMNSLLVTSVVAPIATVISCGSKSEDRTEFEKLADKLNDAFDDKATINYVSADGSIKFIQKLTTPDEIITNSKENDWLSEKISKSIENDSYHNKRELVFTPENKKLLGVEEDGEKENKTKDEDGEKENKAKELDVILKVKKGFADNKITISTQSIIYIVTVDENGNNKKGYSKEDVVAKSKWHDIEITITINKTK